MEATALILFSHIHTNKTPQAIIDAVDSRGRSALYMAASYEQEDVVRCLLGAWFSC
jgi:hypothetical protein